MNIKYNVKTKVDGKYVQVGNIQEGDKGLRLGLRMTAQFKKMVADAEIDSWQNYLLFLNDRSEGE